MVGKGGFMKNTDNKEEFIKLIIFAIIIILLIIFAMIIHRNYDFDSETKNRIINTEDFPIDNLNQNKIQEVQGVNNIYYYELEDYEDFQFE